jgi:NAD(P)-dependent dehydrogenase (short-subunit alcohol dehydrogenase family)
MKATKRAKTLDEIEPRPPFPAKKLKRPGLEAELEPKPKFEGVRYLPAGKLKGKTALITGGDSGIGRSVAFLFAREGADIAINYLPEEQVDAEETQRAVEGEGSRCVLIPGDLRDREFCDELIDRTMQELGKIDILVSNAAYQTRKPSLEDISDEELEKTFETNVFALFRLTRRALPHMKRGSSIIVTSSETGLFGSEQLLDYSSTKGAINAFVKALAHNLVEKGIRVNAVAPGPVWTPLNPVDEGMPASKVAKFGEKTEFKRPAQPEEIAPAYVFLASDADSSFITGHVLPRVGDQTSG